VSYIDYGDGFLPVHLSDVRRCRRERQELILQRRREVTNEPHCWRLSVSYFDQSLMGGWHAFLDRQHESIWIDRDMKWLKEPLMQMFPFSLFDDWQRL